MEGEKNQYQGEVAAQEEEVKSRGLFDFMKNKGEEKKEEKKEEEVIVSGMENVHVTEVEKMETEKKEGLFAKLHRSDSSSSSSVSFCLINRRRILAYFLCFSDIYFHVSSSDSVFEPGKGFKSK